MRRFWIAACAVMPLVPGLALAQNNDAPPPGAMQGPAGGPMSGPWHGPGDNGPGGKRAQDPAAFVMKFYAANTTHDGHLTLAQARAGGLRSIADHFSDIDVKQRGYVTLYDIEAWHLDDVAKRMEARAARLRAKD
ncbi:hypothetical protein [Acidocella sp.]|uniref:hypothetical protein n=1 Tax=Acidocella sp. TaxID=50710 RepID=UPI00261ADB03|nr:hypothetical protein [Acidocella sp.]